MGGATWLAAPAGVLSLVLMGGLRGRKGSKKGKKDDGARLSEDEGVSFTCERVCTSDALLTRLGGLTKEPTPGTCVTVCGTSGADACTEACQRAVCLNPHQVPAWNDACLKRCTQECRKGRTQDFT